MIILILKKRLLKEVKKNNCYNLQLKRRNKINHSFVDAKGISLSLPAYSSQFLMLF